MSNKPTPSPLPEKVYSLEKDLEVFESGAMQDKEAAPFFAWLLKSGEILKIKEPVRLASYLKTLSYLIGFGLISPSGEVLKTTNEHGSFGLPPLG